VERVREDRIDTLPLSGVWPGIEVSYVIIV
jgi:hypothetical protein